ncbi:MAG: DUF4198 domain-containing protein [Pseudomonadota bacterium]
MLSKHIKNSLLFGVSLSVLAASPATAHFQTLYPSSNIVDPSTGRDVRFDLSLTHPGTQGPAMEMAFPAKFGYMLDGKTTNLLDQLTPKTVDGQSAFSAEISIKRPGGYVFYVEPAPYYESAEEKYIVLYTKTVIDAFGAGDNWDAMIGFPVEIDPLTRPYGLWTGNLFQGVVRHNGEAVPFAEIEVEFANDGSVSLPGDSFATQIVKADGNGVFSYAMPHAGWWGFAALIEDGTLKSPDGQSDLPVERGGVIWVHTSDMD